MPPWHADPAIGHFSNARRLSDEQKSTISRWAEAGAPEGDPQDLPPMPTYADGWRLGEPDVVLSMQEDYPIPATGTVPYQYFEVPANFAEDRYITAWEMRPGNRSGRAPRNRQYPSAAADARAAGEDCRRNEGAGGESGDSSAAGLRVCRGHGDSRRARLVDRPLPSRSGNRQVRTIARVRAVPALRSAATFLATRRACFPKARASVFLRARRSCSRCTTRQWARRRPIAPGSG